MSTRIIFKNLLNIAITEQQANMSSEYRKFTVISDKVKMIEEIRPGRNKMLTTVEYFLDPTESKADILNQYSDEANHVNCMIYFNKADNAYFELWDYESYSTMKELRSKGNRVFDHLHRTILFTDIDRVTNTFLGGFKKYYSDIYGDEAKDLLLNFRYDENGNIDLIHDEQEKFGYIEGITLKDYLDDEQFSQYDFPWEQHPYYHSINPYLPSGTL